jgi:pilus assembly protein Flp/PilA
MIQYLQILLNARRDDERGATAVEYGLLIALIAAAIILVVTQLGGALADKFGEVSDAVTGA